MIAPFNINENNIVRIFTYITIFWISTFSNFAFAYIGPGLGAGTVGVILGVIGSIFLALFAIFWYPLKRFFKKFRKPPPELEIDTSEGAEDDAESSEGSNKPG